MRKVYSSGQIQDFEKSIFIAPNDDWKLMRQASAVSAAWLIKKFPKKNFIVLCGPGNNGGDGYYIALELSKLNCEVSLIDVFNHKKKSSLCAKAFLDASNLNFITAREFKTAGEDSVIVDAILGIGGRPGIQPELAGVLELSERFQHRIAIDMPTGVDSDTGKTEGKSFIADATITFIGIKIGQLINQGKIYTGDIILQTLDLKMEDKIKPIANTLTINDVQSLFPKRAQDSHKGNHGKLLIIAGDEGYGGAGTLASETAVKTGSGLVKLLTRECYVASNLARNPEIIVCGGDNAQDLESHFPWADVFVCGPGMFHNYWSEQLLYKLIEYAQKYAVPTLLDAGALRLLEMEAFAQLILPKNLIITPHPGEAAGLLNISVNEVQADRLKAAKDLHIKFGGTIVLKGYGTIIYDGDNTYLCSVGGPELGVPGSGDVLSGLIGSLVSQGLKPMDAAVAGVALHSGAGNQFTKNIGVIGLAASELVPLIRNLLN